MYILNIARAMKKMPVKEIKEFIFENYYKQIKKRFAVAGEQINRKTA